MVDPTSESCAEAEYCFKVDQKWEVKGSFKRWWHADIWREFFGAMINIQGVEKVKICTFGIFLLLMSNCFDGSKNARIFHFFEVVYCYERCFLINE